MDDDWGNCRHHGKAKQPVPEPKYPPKAKQPKPEQHWKPPEPAAPPTKHQRDAQKPRLQPTAKPTSKITINIAPKRMPQKNSSSPKGSVNKQVANTAKEVLADFDNSDDDILDELTRTWNTRGANTEVTTGMSERLRQENGGKTQRGTP